MTWTNFSQKGGGGGLSHLTNLTCHAGRWSHCLVPTNESTATDWEIKYTHAAQAVWEKGPFMATLLDGFVDGAFKMLIAFNFMMSLKIRTIEVFVTKLS